MKPWGKSIYYIRSNEIQENADQIYIYFIFFHMEETNMEETDRERLP